MERMCVLLADVLERQGWRATIVGPLRLPTRWEFRLGLGHPVRSLSAAKAARSKHPDLVVSNNYLGIGIPSRIPRVHVYHGTMVGGTKAQADSLPRRELVRRSLSAGVMEALAGRGARRVVCVSESTAAEVHRYYRLAETSVIPNGIDTATFAPRDQLAARERLGLPPNARYATFVGRFERSKGGQLALEAAAPTGYELLIAGPIGTEHDVQRGTRHLGVLPPERLADAYAAADCVLFPSRYEGCSLVVLEALACGRPLITTRVGWMNTLLRAVPEYDRLCVQPTVEDVRERLLNLSEMDTAPMISAARAFVLENNSLDAYARHWQTLLQGLCG